MSNFHSIACDACDWNFKEVESHEGNEKLKVFILHSQQDDVFVEIAENLNFLCDFMSLLLSRKSTLILYKFA